MVIGKYYINGYNLSIKDIVAAVRGELGEICLAPEAEEKCKESRSQITKWLEKDAPVVYGVNTGLGNLKDTVLSPEDHLKWNKTIPYPHAVGMGNYINPDITRASLLIRANVLSRGYSAVRPELIQRMLDIFNERISPAVFELGSTGLSDLGPLAQSAMVVAGLDEGQVFYKGERKKARLCFKELGLDPIFTLQCKEVLAQMNGSTMTQAIAVFACYNMKQLLSLQHEVEGCIANENDYMIDSKEEVYSALDKTFKFILDIVNFENNITCDNPLLFKVEDGSFEPVMGCNCSNTQVGYALDILNVVIAEKSNFINEMVSRHVMNNGIRLQANSILKEIKSLCLPASADSIPTKGNQEDHVEFSYGAARKAMKAVRLYKLLLCYLIKSLISFESDTNKNIVKDLRDYLNSKGVYNLNYEVIKIIGDYLDDRYFLLGLD